MQVSMLCVAKRTQSVRKGMRRGAAHDIEIIVPTLQRGDAVLEALRRQEDAERPERHATRSAARY
ncbi:hypothetical protein AL048_22690 [Pseudomonas syringae pv. castaneae]|nr:hypothetical protein AL048_22690 [Pseudomonas syringae pv. castaneae]